MPVPPRPKPPETALLRYLPYSTDFLGHIIFSERCKRIGDTLALGLRSCKEELGGDSEDLWQDNYIGLKLELNVMS